MDADDFYAAGFYEDDEPVEKIQAAWEAGEKGLTAPPRSWPHSYGGTARCTHFQAGGVTAVRCGMGCGDLPVYALQPLT